MKKIFLVGILFVFLLTGCGASEDTIQTAIAETEAARPTEIYTPEPTSTFTVTPTLTDTPTVTPSETPTPSDTPTETPTFTPTPDIRIISVDPRAFLLEKEDLPEDARYYLPGPDWISPHHNAEIISGWGTKEGLEYLDETGRIDGWVVYYSRGSNTVIAPEEIFHNIIQYKDASGALLTVEKYGIDIRDDRWKPVIREIDIRGISYAYLYKDLQSNGRYRVWYRVETVYRNYVSIVDGYGWEEEVRYEYVEDIARTAIEKLVNAPLELP